MPKAVGELDLIDKEAITGPLWYKYRRLLLKIGQYSLLEDITIQKIRDDKNKHLIQSGYRDKRAVRFRGNLIQFFLWISMVHVVSEVRREMPEGSSLVRWALSIVSHYDDDPLRVDIKNLLNFFTRYNYFFSAFKAEIHVRPYPAQLKIKEEWGTTDEMKEIFKCDCVFAAFSELVLYHDEAHQKRPDHADLVKFIEEMVI